MVMDYSLEGGVGGHLWVRGEDNDKGVYQGLNYNKKTRKSYLILHLYARTVITKGFSLSAQAGGDYLG